MGAPLLVLVSALSLLALAVRGMLAGSEPWSTWFYPLAWYPTLLAADALIRLRTGRWYLLGHAAFAATLLAWSVPFWLFFELVNFRIANWYYVFVPDHRLARWTAVALSFATVFPLVFVTQRLLEVFGVGAAARTPTFSVPDSAVGVLQACGVAFLALALLWPTYFFPLVWGGVTLVFDPWVYRREPDRSLLGALERGRPGVVVRLLLGGLAAGFLWELYNTGARGRWIYTVPGLEEVKLFEMPVLGFLGFPVLALDGWAVWNALVVAGLAADPDGPPEAPDGGRGHTGRLRQRGLSARRLVLAGPPALLASAAVLLGMERWTIASTTPRMDAVVGEAAPLLSAAGYDVFALARADPAGLARATGRSEAEAWVRRARLATHRGLGAEGAHHLERAGFGSVAALRDADAAEVVAALRATGSTDVRPARVRVWIRGARGRR